MRAKIFFLVPALAFLASLSFSPFAFSQEERSDEQKLQNVTALAQAQTPAQNESVQDSRPLTSEPQPEASARTLEDLINQARRAKDSGDAAGVYAIVEEIMQRFGPEARREQASLKGFPSTEQIKNYEILSLVAQAQFIKAEALKKEGKNEEAAKAFGVIISDFGYAQSWDPRGWFYRTAEVAQEGIDRIEGRDPRAERCGDIPPTRIELNDPGKEEIVDYTAYGEFSGVGTKEYKYTVKKQEALSEAVGEGIYPNTIGIRWDPLFQELKKGKRLEGNHWDFVHSPDLQAAFFKWATAPEPPGIRQYYTAVILEKSGLIKHAIKAYYATAIHFPKTVGWTYWHTPWYVGPASIARIKYLCKKYPQVNMKLVEAEIQVENGFDNDIRNDEFIVRPGRIIKNHMPETITDKVRNFIDRKIMQNRVRRELGRGAVRLVQYENGDWQMLVDNKPFIMQGVTYAVAKVGQSPDDGSLTNWMDYDFNNNGKSDGPYDAFVDANGNNEQDPQEPSVGDFELMKRMGVNTIRLYHQPHDLKKELLRDLFKRYGIRVVIGDFLGKYALGSGASWHEGTDYDNPKHQQAMLDSVRKMVTEHKDEPYLLMWLLGNENVYGVACNADKKPASFFKFVNEAARLIKSIDPNHPVGVASGDILYLDHYAAHCPDVDVFGANAYRGEQGFGSYWADIKRLTDRPAMVTEYGCPAYVYCYSLQEAEKAQADYLQGSWEDIRENAAFGQGSGNSVGAFLFEYLDEWWKGYEPAVHDTKGLWVGPFPDGFMHEEWLGVAGQGDGKMSPFLRHLRKSYYTYEKLWKGK
ncbi:MAG: glycoside hydrolase family 2 TIM barrel-domain containing protein [Candidatus Omnitrophota bacterium]